MIQLNQNLKAIMAVLLALMANACGDPPPEPSNNLTRIIGGKPGAIEEYPYQVGIFFSIMAHNGSGPRNALCGGALIATNRVLTAAHCWFNGTAQANNTMSVFGTSLLYVGGSVMMSKDVVTHPQWDPVTNRNDIAVIRLPKDVKLSRTIQIIRMLSGNELTKDYTGETAIATGYGLTSDDGKIDRNQSLKYISVPIISNTECKSEYGSVIQDSNICTSSKGKVGTCQGDSGGPLVVTINGEHVLIGVTSFGTKKCETDKPDVYTFVGYFDKWINGNM